MQWIQPSRIDAGGFCSNRKTIYQGNFFTHGREKISCIASYNSSPDDDYILHLLKKYPNGSEFIHALYPAGQWNNDF